MQLSLATNYPSSNALVEAIQTHAIAKEYVIVKSQSKARYKSNIVTKVDIICERNDELRRKLKIK
jgi:hypothetical protein